MKLATRDIVREIDRISIEEYGIQGLILMENAGRAVAEVVLDEFPKVKRVAIFAGGGNNGGDGFVVGRHLMNKGLDVTTYLTVDPKKYKGDALINFQALRKIGGEIIRLNNGFAGYKGADLIVDALFGTGLDREVDGFFREGIDYINSQAVPRIAVDIPSGLDSDPPCPRGFSGKAECPSARALPKRGPPIYPGINY